MNGEVLAGIRCDLCNRVDLWPHAGKTYIRQWAKDDGWLVGKVTVCPDCRMAHGTGESGNAG